MAVKKRFIANSNNMAIKVTPLSCAPTYKLRVSFIDVERRHLIDLLNTEISNKVIFILISVTSQRYESYKLRSKFSTDI